MTSDEHWADRILALRADKLDEVTALECVRAVVRVIQRDALESAAKECEPMVMTQEPCTATAEECMAAIRKLKPEGT